MAYDQTWAEEVYENFYQVHIFACREMNRLYSISVEAIVKTIMMDSVRWRGYKALVKHGEKAIHIYWKHFHSGEEVRKKYYTFDKYLKEQFKKRKFPAPLDLVDTSVEQELGL